MNIRDIKFEDYPLFLAPMEDVSDPPFRALCKKHGADFGVAGMYNTLNRFYGNSIS